MFKKALKYAAVGLFFALCLLVILVLSLEPLLNTAWFKSALNGHLLKGKGRVDYARVEIFPFSRRVAVRGLSLELPGVLRARVKGIYLSRLFTRAPLVAVSGGRIVVEGKGAPGGGGGAGGFSLPFTPQISIRDLAVVVRGVPVTIRRLEAKRLKTASFRIELAGKSFVEGVATYRGGAVVFDVGSIVIDTARLRSLLCAVGVKTGLDLINRPHVVRVDGVKVEVSFSPFVLRAHLARSITISGAEGTIRVNQPGGLLADVRLTFEGEGGILTVDARGVKGGFSDVRRLVGLFTKPEVLVSTVYPMVKRAFVEEGEFRIKEGIGSVKGTKELFLKARVRDAVVAVLHTHLVAKRVAASVLLQGDKLRVDVARARVGGLRVLRAGVVVGIREKPTSVRVRADVEGDAADVYPVVEGLPLDEGLKKEIYSHRLLRGRVSARVSLLVRGSRVVPDLRVKVENALLKERFLSSPLGIASVSLRVSGEKVFISASGIKGEGFSLKGLSLRIMGSRTLFAGNGLEASLGGLDAGLSSRLKALLGLSSVWGRVSSGGFKGEASSNGLSSLKLPLRLEKVGGRALVSGKSVPFSGVSGTVSVDYPVVSGHGISARMWGVGFSGIGFRYGLKEGKVSVSFTCRDLKGLSAQAERMLSSRLPVVFGRGAELRAGLSLDLKRHYYEAKGALSGNGARIEVRKLVLSGHGATGRLEVFTPGNRMELSLSWNGRLHMDARGGLDVGSLFSLVRPRPSGLSIPASGLISASFSFDYSELEGLPERMKGVLKAQRLVFGSTTLSLFVEGRGDRVLVRNCVISSPQGESVVSGVARLPRGKRPLEFSLRAYGSFLNLNDLLAKNGGEKKASGKKRKVRGDIKFFFSKVIYKELKVSDVQGSFRIDESKGLVEARVTRANLCGFNVKGNYLLKGEHLEVEASGSGTNSFENLFVCMLHKKPELSGLFDYKASLSYTGPKDGFLKGAKGVLVIVSDEGRVYKLQAVIKVLQFFTLSNILHLDFKEVSRKGVPYKKLRMKVKLKRGKVKVKNSYVECTGVKFVFTGDVDLVKKRMNIVVLAAPFTTVDKIISKVPVLGRILTGRSKTFLSIPVRVVGPVKDPAIIPLSPTAIGKGLFNVLKRTLSTPLHVLEMGEHPPEK